MKQIDYVIVEEYLDQELEADPGLLMNGITPLYKQVAKHFRQKDRKHSIYSRQSIRQAVRDYYDSKNVDPKILVKMQGYERKGLTYSAEHKANIGLGVRKTWTEAKRLAHSERLKEVWEKRRKNK